ncbi:hypothetical protein GCM10025734_73530 [Kitasatospora paranensis]
MADGESRSCRAAPAMLPDRSISARTCRRCAFSVMLLSTATHLSPATIFRTPRLRAPSDRHRDRKAAAASGYWNVAATEKSVAEAMATAPSFGARQDERAEALGPARPERERS